MKFVTGLTCHLCGATYPAEALWVCGECLGPLEVSYDYEAVRSAVAQSLRQQSFATALRQYLLLLTGQARMQGVDLDAAATPLVQ